MKYNVQRPMGTLTNVEKAGSCGDGTSYLNWQKQTNTEIKQTN